MDVNAEDIENDGSISKVGQSTQNYRKLFWIKHCNEFKCDQ